MQRWKTLCSLTFFLAAAAVGWPGPPEPWEVWIANPVAEYSAYVRDQSLLYARRLNEGEAGMIERRRIADEYRRDLEERLHLLMEEWEMTARNDLLSRQTGSYNAEDAAGFTAHTVMEGDSIQPVPSVSSSEITELEADLVRQKQRYLRECGQIGELFSRHYILTEMDCGREACGGSGAPFTMVEAELQMLSTAEKDLQGLSEWRSAEEELTARMIDWERKLEQQYSAERRKIEERYTALRELEESWKSGFKQILERNSEQWEENIEAFKRERQAAEGQMIDSVHINCGIFKEEAGKLLGVLSRARELRDEAGSHIFVGDDIDYWSTVWEKNAALMQESLEIYGEIAPLGNGADGTVFELAAGLSGERLTHAGRERDYLEELIHRLQETGQRVDSAEGPGGLLLESLLPLLDSGEKKDLQHILEDELQLSAARYKVLSDEHAVRMEHIESAREAMEESERVAAFQLSLAREKSFRELQRRIQAAAGTLAVQEAGLVAEREEVAEERRSRTARLIPSGAVTGPEFLDVMKSRYYQEGSDAVLRDLALSFYHEHAEEIDPGCMSRNQVYRTLKEKIGYTEDSRLADQAESARQRICSLPEGKELYGLYSGLLSAGKDEKTLLYRAMVEDTGQILLRGIMDSSGDKIDNLKTERGILYGQAAYYGGLAALCYATFNFGGGAALSAIAAGFMAAAGEVGKEIGDIRILRESLQEQPMSGREEREEFMSGIDELRSLDDRLTEVEQHEGYLKTQHYTPQGWLEELGDNESPLWGLVDADFLPAAEELCDTLPEIDRNKMGVFEFFHRLDSEAEKRKAACEFRNNELIQESADTLREFRLAALSGNSSIRITEAGLAAEILRTAAQDPDVQTYSRLAELGALEEEGRLTEFLCRMDCEEAGYFQFHRQQEHLAELFLRAGQEKWEAEKDLLEDEAARWEEDFRREYRGNRRMWNARMQRFEEGRRLWIEQAAADKAHETVTDGISVLGIDPDGWQRHVAAVPLDRLPSFHFPERLPADLPALPLQKALSDERPTEFSPSTGIGPVSADCRSAGYHNRIDRLYERAEEMMQETAFQTGMEKMSRIIEGHQQELAAAVECANDDIRVSLHAVLKGAGYRRDGSTFERKSLIDVTLFSRERELHAIGAYRDFELPEMNWAGKLRSCMENSQGYEEAERKYRGCIEEIGAQRRLIFGGYDGTEESILEKVSEAARELFLTERQDFSTSGQYEKYRDSEGLFAWHVGYAPEMDPDNPGRVHRAGSGEVGRIMASYYRNETRLSRGLSLLDTAVWDRKVWDDDHDNDGEADGFFRAPTARSLADIGMQAAAALFLAPGVASVLAGLADDAFFRSADAVGGYSSAGEALCGFGKTALLQGSLAGNDLLWNTGGSQTGWIDGDGLFEGILPALGKTAGDSLITSSAAALSFEAGSFHWDGDQFFERLGSRESRFTLAAAAAGSLSDNMVRGSLYDRRNTYGFSQYDLQQMERAAGTGGRLAAAGLEYLYTGSSTLNLAGAGGTGLLEFHLDSGGAFLAAGSGGRRFAAADVIALRGGLENFILQHRINRYAEREFAAPELQALAAQVLRFQASFGDRDARKVVTGILRGRDDLIFREEADYRGRTRAAENGGRIIDLNLNPRSGLDPASHAVTLQHEAHRDGASPCSPEMNRGETVQAVRAHTGMAGRITLDPLYSSPVFSQDPQLFVDMAVMAENRAGAAGIHSMYSSEADYWKLTGTGAILWDGSHHLWTDGGKLMIPHRSGSFSRDIADYLGIPQTEARSLMEKAGLMWDSDLGTYRQEASDYQLTAPAELYARYDLLNRFGAAQEGAVPVGGNQAYAWAVREHALRTGCGSYGDRQYEQGMEESLSSRERFLEAAGLTGRTEFPGITGRADLTAYSQQWLEMSTTGKPLDASKGEGYCLAESIACRYVDRYKEVDWKAVRTAFAETDWGTAFDPSTGMVGDKQLFTAGLAASFDVDSTAREYRFDALGTVQDFIEQTAGNAAGAPEYSVVADYGGHFTCVRPDGLEINTYPGWNSVGREPTEWRVYLWD